MTPAVCVADASPTAFGEHSRLVGDEAPPIGLPLVEVGERNGVPMFEAAP